MGYAELIERLRALPRDKRAEVFDFVEFLAVRSRAAAAGDHLAQGEWANSEFSNLAMTQALRGMEDDSVAYSAADLRERWQ